MKTFDNKISTKQAYMIFFVALCSPLIRLLPIQLSRYSRGTVWIAPFILFALFLVVVFLLNQIFKNNKSKGFIEIINDVFGKVLGKIILIIYIVYFLVLTSVYVRYLGERLLSSIYVYAPLQFFTGIILIVAFLVVKNTIENLGRLAEIFSYIFMAVLILIFMFSFQNITPMEFTFPGVADIGNNARSIPILTALASYFVYTMFLGENIVHKDTLKKYGLKAGIGLLLFSAIILFVTVGTFGYNLTEKLTLPFFSAIKNIELFGTIERTESIFLGIWIVTDFVLITMFIYIISNITKHVSKTKDIKYISTPIIFIIYFLSTFIANNSFQLELLSSTVLIYLNLVFGFIVPVIILIVGKIRKKV